MQESKHIISQIDIRLIEEALTKGLDVRIHLDTNGLKITSERVHVLRSPKKPQYGFSDKRE